MGRKNPKLIVDGYEFKFEKHKGNGSFWTCPTYQRTKCKSRLITRGSIVFLRHLHNHEPKELDLRTMSYKYVLIKRQ